jgi:hypothetical protein
MSRLWIEIFEKQGTAWGIPPVDVTELSAAFDKAQAILQTALSADRTPAVTTECQRIFSDLIQKMRYIKDRYLKIPPLVEEDFTSLLLKAPDPTRSRRGTPKAQMTAEIGRSGTAMLILHYKYAEGTEMLANPDTDLRYQVRYGLLPPPGLTPASRDIMTIPREPEDLPIVFSTKRKKDIVNFEPNDSGKTAYFCIRIENGSGQYGPWCPVFSAIVP